MCFWLCFDNFLGFKSSSQLSVARMQQFSE
jgi:hypothetical protein